MSKRKVNAQGDRHAPLTERQRIVAFIAGRLYPAIHRRMIPTSELKPIEQTVLLAGWLLDEVIKQNP